MPNGSGYRPCVFGAVGDHGPRRLGDNSLSVCSRHHCRNSAGDGRSFFFSVSLTAWGRVSLLTSCRPEFRVTPTRTAALDTHASVSSVVLDCVPSLGSLLSLLQLGFLSGPSSGVGVSGAHGNASGGPKRAWCGPLPRPLPHFQHVPLCPPFPRVSGCSVGGALGRRTTLFFWTPRRGATSKAGSPSPVRE